MERSREFREVLLRELPVWESDGIVTPGAARALAARYDLDEAALAASSKERTATIAAGTGVAVAAALTAALAGGRDGVLLPLVALAAAFAAAPLVARDDAFAAAAAGLRAVGRSLFYVAAWALSFVAIAEAVGFRQGLSSPGVLASLPPFLLAAFAVAAGLRRSDVDAHARGEAMLLAATVLAFAAGLALEGGHGTAVVANLGLAFLAVGRVVRGVTWRARGPFWEGLAVAAVLVASRVSDVVAGPWLGAAVGAVLAGALVAGVLFERHRARAAGPAGVPAA